MHIAKVADQHGMCRAERLLLRGLSRKWPEPTMEAMLRELLRRMIGTDRNYRTRLGIPDRRPCAPVATLSAPVGQGVEQPGAGRLPVALHGGRREADGLRGFFDRQATEIAQLDDPAPVRIDGFEPDECVVE